MSKTMIKVVAVTAMIIVALLIVGAFLDLEISDALYQGEDSVSQMIGGFAGKLPAYAILVFCFFLLFNYVVFHASEYNKVGAVVLYILYTMAILASSTLMIYSALEELTSRAKLIAVELAIILTIVLIIVAVTREMRYAPELKKWAILSIISIAVTICLVIILKVVWGRARYEDVLSHGAIYTPWYMPRGVTGGHSFPSGHTALWGTLFVLVPLFRIFGYKGEGLLSGFIVLSSLMIGLFRVTGGHHFMSDTVFAMILPAVTTLITMRIGFKPDYSDRYLGEHNIFRHI